MDENTLRAIVEEVVNKAVEPIKKTLENHSGALINIESKLDAFADLKIPHFSSK